MRYKTDQQARDAVRKWINPKAAGYCCVVSTAQVTDCSMSRAYHACKRAGRPDTDGMSISGHMQAMSELGYQGQLIGGALTLLDNGDSKNLTINQAIKKYCEAGKTYILYTRNHVITYRDGQVRDWHAVTHAGKAIRKRCDAIYEMTKKTYVKYSEVLEK